MSTALNWDVVRGDNTTLPLAMTWADGSTDITGAELRMYVRDSLDGVVATRANTAAGGDATQIAITDALAGEFEVYCTPSLFAGLLGRTGTEVALKYDIEATRADGTVETCADGTIRVRLDVTT